MDMKRNSADFTDLELRTKFGLRARTFTLALGALCVLSCGALSALARPALLLDDDDVPTDSKRVATDAREVRLSSVEGNVQVVQDGEIIADPAFVNVPLFEGSQVITGDEGRAEVQLEDGSVARISPNTTLTLSVLQRQGTGTRTEIVVNTGLAYFELQPSNGEHNLRVNYGTASFSASSFSVIRVTMDGPPGQLAVFSGNVHLERGNDLQLDIHGGESLSLNGTDSNGYNISETIQQDSWDSWNEDRDQVLNAQSAQKTAATSGGDASYQGVGMSDLDANGNWYNVPGQGYVWSPYDAEAEGADFDPYGFGHWVNYPGRGYLWVSGYGWGYAPYRCGLWNYYDSFGWGWAPGGCNGFYGGYGGYGGGGGWFNIGHGPHGYRPPRRPLPGPIHPHPGGPHSGGARTGLASIPVDRRPVGGPSRPVSGRQGEPIVIAGHTVEPLRPVAPREGYGRPGNSFTNPGGLQNGSPRPGTYGGGSHPVYPGIPGGRPMPGQAGGYRPAPPSANRPQPMRPAPSYGGGGSRPSGGGSAPAPRPSGGGGGGAPHPSGGGAAPHK